MQFKTPMIASQYLTLQQKNPKLWTIGHTLDVFTFTEYGKEITLTNVFETEEEFQAIYAHVPEAQRPKTSPHEFWHAFDVRSTDFTEAQRQKMLTLLNCFTYSSGQGKPVAIYHMISGNVFHFHVQAD